MATALALDGFINKMTKPLTNSWCKVTGRSNFKLARGLLKLAVLLMWIGGARFAVLGRTFDAMWGFIGAAIWTFVGQKRLATFARLETWSENPSDTLPVTRHELYSFGMDRILFSFVMLMFTPFLAFPSFSTYGLYFYGLSHHVATHFNGGGKSLVKRGVEALKKAASKVAERVGDLAPQPQPIPVPIGV